MSFHRRLKHERLVKGWTIEQLSQASGVTASRISMLERNLVDMVSDSTKDQLAKALGVDFQAPTSVAPGTVSEAVPSQSAASPTPAAPTEPAAPSVPEPLALHLSTPLQQQLEAAAHAHGRSLHGEILARLEASLAGAAEAPAPDAAAVSVASAPADPRAANGVIQLSEADWAHITEQVALRLQARR